MGVKGLALGHALGYLLGVVLQARLLRKRIGGLDGARVLTSIGKIALAATVMGVLVWSARVAIDRVWEAESLLGQGLGLAGPILVGIVSFLGLTVALRVEEVGLLRNIVTRRRTDRTS
jgi:putative peptidoglycan lipid II flippase